jgi:hypothetical protein
MGMGDDVGLWQKVGDGDTSLGGVVTRVFWDWWFFVPSLHETSFGFYFHVTSFQDRPIGGEFAAASSYYLYADS